MASAVILVSCGVSAVVSEANVWIHLFRGLAGCIGLYVLMSIVACVLPDRRG